MDEHLVDTPWARHPWWCALRVYRPRLAVDGVAASRIQERVPGLTCERAVNKTTLTELGFVVGASVKPKADSASAPKAAASAASASAPQAVSASAQNIVAIGDDIVELADQTKLTF